jgi:phage head maturation protease
MTDLLTIDAGTLTASADDRTVTGLLVPFGEECRSNLGKFTVGTGAFSIPADHSVMGFNREHAREDVLGRATKVHETPEGIVATFSIAKTPEGDTALEDVKAGRMKHLSAEVSNVVIRAGKAVGGKLFGGALVQTPAFPSATLLAAAEDVGDVPAGEPQTTETKTSEEFTDESGKTFVRTTVTTTTVDGDTTTIKTTETITEPEEPAETEPEVATATVPGTLTATGKNEKKAPNKFEFFTLLAAHDTGALPADQLAAFAKDARATSLFAALSDIKYDKTGGVTTGISLPQWIGEVWDGNEYVQKYLPLFSHDDLNSLEFIGYKWDVKPHGGDWAGNKSDVPSNTPKFKAVKASASRYAMAHDIARELQDLKVFGDSSFFDAYFKAGAEDYARWADAKVLDAAKTNAVTIKADNPAGLAVGPAMSALVDGAAAVLAANATPTFALVELGYWKSIAKTPAQNVLGYLNAQLGLTPESGQLDTFRLIPTTDLAAGNVLVGATNALTVRELPGAPIRVDALDIARGGIDQGLFGYAGVQVNKPDALQLVTPYTA